jgi:hypothetical protein
MQIYNIKLLSQRSSSRLALFLCVMLKVIFYLTYLSICMLKCVKERSVAGNSF